VTVAFVPKRHGKGGEEPSSFAVRFRREHQKQPLSNHSASRALGAPGRVAARMLFRFQRRRPPGRLTTGERGVSGLRHVVLRAAGKLLAISDVAQFGSSDVCVERTAHYCAVALAAPDTGTTASDVDACGQAMTGESCSDLLTENDPAACKAPTGSRPALQNDPASVCVFGSQCASGSCIGAGNLGASDDCGICYGFPGGSPGDACNGVAANSANLTMPLFHDDLLAYRNDCSNGLACSGPTSGPHTCQPAGHQGDKCDDSHPCSPDLLCENGQCGALHREGEPCAAFTDCDLYHLFACGTDGQVPRPEGGAAGRHCGRRRMGFNRLRLRRSCRHDQHRRGRRWWSGHLDMRSADGRRAAVRSGERHLSRPRRMRQPYLPDSRSIRRYMQRSRRRLVVRALPCVLFCTREVSRLPPRCRIGRWLRRGGREPGVGSSCPSCSRRSSPRSGCKSQRARQDLDRFARLGGPLHGSASKRSRPSSVSE